MMLVVLTRSLNMRNGPDSAVEASGPKAKALADILQEEVAFDVPLKSNLSTFGQTEWLGTGAALTQHAWRNVDACPYVPLLVEDLPRQARAAADVEQKRRLIGWQGEQLERTICHVRLNGLDAGAAALCE
jgi:hypothetical protein